MIIRQYLALHDETNAQPTTMWQSVPAKLILAHKTLIAFTLQAATSTTKILYIPSGHTWDVRRHNFCSAAAASLELGLVALLLSFCRCRQTAS